MTANLTTTPGGYETDRYFSKRTWLMFVLYGLVGVSLALLL